MVGVVLGVSTAPTELRMVLVEGESADGVIVDQDNFDVSGDGSPSTVPSQVVSAILGTREGAAEGGYRLLSSGVACTDHTEAALLRDTLIAHKIENVMLVSAFMAAAALAQAVGDAISYARTALLFVEPYTATLAMVNTSDGSVFDVQRRLLSDDEDRAVRASISMITELRRWNAERVSAGKRPIDIGVGLNTDSIVSGNIGSPKRMDYTVIGDGVNLASRLESACKDYGARILISENTSRKLRGTYRMREVDRVVVKGKSEPSSIFEVLDYHTDETFPICANASNAFGRDCRFTERRTGIRRISRSGRR